MTQLERYALGTIKESGISMLKKENLSLIKNRGGRCFCIGNGQLHDALTPSEEVSKTLNCMDDTMKILLENHPADSRVRVCEDGIAQTLSSRMGTRGGNTPMVMEFIKGDDLFARTQNKALHLLWESYGTQAVVEWGIASMDALQQAEVLQHRIDRKSVV